jgi:hypothetical protein
MFFMPFRFNTDNTDSRPRYLTISREPPLVAWEWYIDPAGMAFDVLQEFKDFGTGPQSGNHGHSHYYIDWPFLYSESERIAANVRWGEAEADEESRLRNFNNRCERREHKKAMKLARAQGLLHRGLKMPGAWID